MIHSSIFIVDCDISVLETLDTSALGNWSSRE